MTDDERPPEATEPDPGHEPDEAVGHAALVPRHPQPAAEDPGDAEETVDKTDMSAVGDDGQVFGG